MMVSLRHMLVAILALGLVGAGSGCAADAEATAKTTLVVETWGNFGYKSLIREYEAAHPNIDVVEQQSAYGDHHDALEKHLDAGKGAGDVVGIDENYVVRFRNRYRDFHNLLDFGAGELSAQWLPWKWQQTLADGGAYQIGLGTDVGGLAMCYRPDLFRSVGLPTEREEVAKLWPTWEAYIAAGRRFTAENPPAQWTDSATNIFNQVLGQQPVSYLDRNERLTIGPSSGVRRAWDLTVEMVNAGQSARYAPFSDEWTAGLQGGRFATLACPAWALGYIQQNAPAARSMWDVTQVPGGAGNWGGTWLAIPKQTSHPDEAYQLAHWLTAPEQQLRIFRETGNLPSQPKLYADPAVVNHTNPFFRDAPVGQIFTAAAQRKQPQYYGLHNSEVRAIFEKQLGLFETNRVSAEQGWAVAVAEARKLSGG